MSCWCRTTVLRVPAIFLGFVYVGEWRQFLKEHRSEFGWTSGYFSSALCTDYLYDDYAKWLEGKEKFAPTDRLDLGVYPQLVKSVPGPFLDYHIEEIAPLQPEERYYNTKDCARPLTQEEKEKYLPLYQTLFPDFTIEDMKDIHYCQYEWYDGSDPPYFY